MNSKVHWTFSGSNPIRSTTMIVKLDHLTKAAISHTSHCLLGCAIGEVLGVVIGTAMGWGDAPTIALAVALAFFFGYLLTFYSAKRKGMETNKAVKTALVTDTASITSMEIVDNTALVLIPGAMEAELISWLFWLSLALALAIAFLVTVPVNRWFMARSGAHHHH